MPKTGPTADTATDPRGSVRILVLQTIRQRGRIARVDIAREAGLSPATVTSITAELMADGLIERILPEVPVVDAPRGRPRETLKIRGEAKLVAGAKVSQHGITLLLVDFEGNEIGCLEWPRGQSQSTGPDLADQIVEATRAACEAQQRDMSEVSAIGVGLAGQVDGLCGHVHWSSALTERNVDLGALLSDRMPCPVFIENDANLVAKAEQLFGQGRDLRDFLVVTIQHGIGLGVVIDGKLYRGARGCGAEFGHTKVNSGGALCQCGQRGCLEAYASEYALLQKAEAAGDDRFSTLAALSAAAQAGDPVAGPIMEEAERYFAMGLANLINLFDPEHVILSVEIMGQHPLCTPSVLASVAQHTVDVDAPLPAISVHNWGDRMWAKGAAAFGIEMISKISVMRLGRSET